MEENKLNHFARLRKLSIKHSQLIALILIERMKINAVLFFKSSNQNKEVDTLDATFESLWNKTLHSQSKFNIDSFQSKLESLLEVCKQNTIGAESTRDMLVAMGVCADVFADSESNPAVQVAKISQGDIERFIEVDTGQQVRASEFRTHELVEYELALLNSLLQFFEDQTPSNSEIVDMRKTIQSLNTSNLGFSSH